MGERKGLSEPLARLQTALRPAVEALKNQKFPLARRLMDNLLRDYPDHPEVLYFSGALSLSMDEYARAELELERAISICPKAEYYLNYALVLSLQDKRDLSEQAYRTSLSLNSRQEQAWNNLGNLLMKQGLEGQKKAIECYEKALALRSDYAGAWNNLGFVRMRLQDLTGAEEAYRRALACDPRFVQALTNSAECCLKRKDAVAALAFFRRAVAMQPYNTKLHADCLMLLRELAQWGDDFTQHESVLRRDLTSHRPSSYPPFQWLLIPDVDAGLLKSAAIRYASETWLFELSQPPLASNAVQRRSGRIRIGYLSADFCNHPLTHLLQEVLFAHDCQQFEIFLYAYGPVPEDEERRLLRQHAEHFVMVDKLSDQEAAVAIQADQIDILLDLNGYTTHARLGITALRPASIIVNWLGYMGSLGHPRLADYIIGDDVITPVGHADEYSETLALMPECYQPNAALNSTTERPPSRATVGLPEDAFVFCSFNQSIKLHPDLWQIWCHILQQVPGSVLWLVQPKYPQACEHLVQQAARHGITADRLIFAPYVPKQQHRARIALADLALDTFPYNGGATSSDTLRAGVPMVTVLGDRMVGRMSASLLHCLGLDELIASDMTRYQALCIDLANNPADLGAIRLRLQQALQNASLYQPQQFCRHLEALFCAMLERSKSHAVHSREPLRV